MKLVRMSLLTVLALAVSVITAFAAAPLTSQDCAIGGIGVGSHYNYITSVYGEPSYIKEGIDQYLHQYSTTIKYSDNFEILLLGDSSSINSQGASIIETKGNTGLATPRGIRVGSTRADVYRAYGPSQGNFESYYFYRVWGVGCGISFEFGNTDRVQSIKVIDREI